MNKKINSIAALFVLLVSSVAAATGEEVLAKKGEIQIAPLDVRANNSQLTELEFSKLLQAEPAYRKSIDEVLSARYAESKVSERMSTLAPADARAIQIAKSRAVLNASLTIAERRARELAQKDSAATERRAREIYETTDAEALKTPLAADIELILFDVTRHDTAAIAKRIADVERAIRAMPEKFPALAAEFSDEDNSRLKSGRIEKVPASSTSELVSRVLFDQLKPGEISKILPHSRGLMFIRLITIHPPIKRPFEGAVKEAAIRRAETEAGLAARDAELERLTKGDDIVFNDEKIRAQLVLPDPTALARWREAQAKRMAQEATGASDKK